MKTFWYLLFSLNLLTPVTLMATKPLVPREALELPVEYAQVGDNDPLIDGVLDEESYEPPPSDAVTNPVTTAEAPAEQTTESPSEATPAAKSSSPSQATSLTSESSPPVAHAEELKAESQTPQNAPVEGIIPTTVNRSATLQSNTQCQQLEQQRLRYEQLSQRHEESMIRLGKLLGPVAAGSSLTPAQERKREQAKILFERLTRNQEQLKIKMEQTVEIRAKQGC